jgi:hypothetical protein
MSFEQIKRQAFLDELNKLAFEIGPTSTRAKAIYPSKYPKAMSRYFYSEPIRMNRHEEDANPTIQYEGHNPDSTK